MGISHLNKIEPLLEINLQVRMSLDNCQCDVAGNPLSRI